MFCTLSKLIVLLFICGNFKTILCDDLIPDFHLDNETITRHINLTNLQHDIGKLKLGFKMANVNMSMLQDSKYLESLYHHYEREFEKQYKIPKAHPNGEETCIQVGKKLMTRFMPSGQSCATEMGITELNFTSLKDIRALTPLRPDGTFDLDFTRDLLSEIVPERFSKVIWGVWDICKDDILRMKGNEPDCHVFRDGYRCLVQNMLKVIPDHIDNLCPDIPPRLRRIIKRLLSSKTLNKLVNYIIR